MQIIINILFYSSIYILISYSFSLIYCTTKAFHIAHASIITFGAFFTYSFYYQSKMSIFIAIPIAILLSVLISLLIELFIYKPLRSKSISSLLLLISSIAINLILQNFISIIWGDDTKSIRFGNIKVGHEFLGAYITNLQVISIVISIVLFLFIILLFSKTKLNRQIRAVSSNEQLANISGINPNRVIFWTFLFSSSFAAIAGILIACDNGLTPTMGFNFLLYGIVVMIIGGVGSIWGLAGGALLLATAQHLGAYYIDSKWIDAIAYLILILFLIWKPLGFSGQHLKKSEI